MKPTVEVLASRPDVQAIKEVVLRHGGTDIDTPDEWLEHVESLWQIWMDPLHADGRLMEPGTHRVVDERMEPRECHKNSSTLFLKEQVCAFATGFALHEDGVWYFHSWGLRSRCCEEVMVETIGEEFAKYFGAVYWGEDGKLRADGLYKTVTQSLWPFAPGKFIGQPPDR